MKTATELREKREAFLKEQKAISDRTRESVFNTFRSEMSRRIDYFHANPNGDGFVQHLFRFHGEDKNDPYPLVTYEMVNEVLNGLKQYWKEEFGFETDITNFHPSVPSVHKVSCVLRLMFDKSHE